jgi:hypothetical protein
MTDPAFDLARALGALERMEAEFRRLGREMADTAVRIAELRVQLEMHRAMRRVVSVFDLPKDPKLLGDETD